MKSWILIFIWVSSAWGQISSGGDYSMELPAPISGGGELLSGGSFQSRAAAGQIFQPPSPYSFLSSGIWELRQGFLSRPAFSFQNTLSAQAQDPSGSLILSFPPLSLPLPTYDISIRQDPLNNPVRVNPNLISQANQKLLANEGPLAQLLPQHLWELNVQDEGGFYDGVISPQGTLSFSYQDANQDGIVDGTNPPVRAKTLKLWKLDETLGLWVKVPDASVDLENRRMTAPLRHLSVYGFIGGADASVGDVYAFPVPFRPFGPDAGTGPGQTGTEAAGITFSNLPSQGSIEIYTLTGYLVRKIDIPANLSPNRLAWDVRNSEDRPVASGVYIWRVVSGENSKKGRLMIIR